MPEINMNNFNIDWNKIVKYISGEFEPTEEMIKVANLIKEDEKSELKHHGIIGQKWGIKNGPPYPLSRGDDEYIAKGTKVERRSSVDKKTEMSNNNPRNNMLYVSKSGSKAAKETWNKYLPYSTNVNQYETIKDAKIAGYDTIKKTIDNMDPRTRAKITEEAFTIWKIYRENPTAFTSFSKRMRINNENYKSQANALKKYSTDAYNKYTKEYDDGQTKNGKKIDENARNFYIGYKTSEKYKSYGSSKVDLTGFVATTLVQSNSTLRKYLETNLSKQGYNGLIDIFGRNDGDDTATILFNKNWEAVHSDMKKSKEFLAHYAEGQRKYPSSYYNPDGTLTYEARLKLYGDGNYSSTNSINNHSNINRLKNEEIRNIQDRYKAERPKANYYQSTLNSLSKKDYKSAVNAAGEGLKRSYNDAKEKVKNTYNEKVAPVLESLKNKISNKTGEIKNKISNKVAEVKDNIAEKKYYNSLSPGAKARYNIVKTGNDIQDKVYSTASSAYNSVKNGINNTINNAKNEYNNTVDYVLKRQKKRLGK